MASQNRTDLNTRPFILENLPSAHRLDKAILAQDAGRADPLESRTLMAKIAATGKWVPFTDETAVDGTAIPAGIFDPEGWYGEIEVAKIVAGDVEDIPIVIFGVLFDDDRLIIENTKTLSTVIGAGTIQAKTVSDVLIEKTLIPQSAVTGSVPENPAP